MTLSERELIKMARIFFCTQKNGRQEKPPPPPQRKTTFGFGINLLWDPDALQFMKLTLSYSPDHQNFFRVKVTVLCV